MVPWADLLREARTPCGRFLCAYALLGIALLAFHLALLPLVLIALWLVITALRMTPEGEGPPQAPPATLLTALLLLLGALSLIRAPGIYLVAGQSRLPFVLLTLLTTGLCVGACRVPHLARPRQVVLLLLIYLSLGHLLLRASPAPRIDVFVYQQQGARDLLFGQDPYESSFPNLYTAEESLRFFGAVRPTVDSYPYPPLSLLLTTASYALFGDVRYVFLLAQLGTGLFLWLLARRRFPEGMATGLLGLHLLHPRGPFVLEQGWTEPLICCAFALFLYLLSRPAGRLARGLALGLFLAAKQYSVLLLPLLLPRRAKLVLLGCLCALLLTAPLLLWHPRSAFADVVLFQLRQPFRPDAMSVPAALYFLTGLRAPGALAILAAGAALFWSHKRLAAGAALTYVVFFLFAKQAFCNYYYFAGVLLLCAAARGTEGARDG